VAAELGPDDLIASYFTLTGAPVMAPARWSFEERVAAAARAGFAGIGMFTDDYKACRDRGLSDADMQRVLADHGIGVPEVEFVFDWAYDGERGTQARVMEERAYAMADAFGARHMNIGDVNPPDELPPTDVVIERFGVLCDRAARHGLQVAIEFLPWTGIPDVAAAWEIVGGAGRANGGVLVDAWHYFRGGADEATLRAIPPEHVVAVQLDDADTEVVGDLTEDTMLRRRLPGEGSFDLVGLIGTLDAMGVSAPLSVEVMSLEQQARPVNEAARVAYDSTRAVVNKARGGDAA